MNIQRSFPSKVLLFGEYSVVLGSDALAFPYSKYSGNFFFPKSEQITSDSELKAFSKYLENLKSRGELSINFSLEQFKADVTAGMTFDSDIPMGYGLGSSGALCAALFDRYYKCEDPNSLDLKRELALLESHFHGSSSGFDPFVSYLAQPVLMKKGESFETLNLDIKNEVDQSKGGFFLLNTGRPRRTEPLVRLFLEKCKTPAFKDLCEEVLIPTTNRCIESFLENKHISLFEEFSLLARFQYRHLNPMIPNLFQELWEEGLSSKNFTLKLCGAGGGGYLLGICRDYSILRNQLEDYDIECLLGLNF